MRYNNKNVLLPKVFVQLDEIWYTSSDGNIVTPYKVSSLPTIVSNTYVDGKGIFKFERDATIIGKNAFDNCSTLTSMMIPNSIYYISDGAFYHCLNLRTINLPNNIINIGASAFDNCRSLTTITIPNSVTSIGDMAFSYCSGLTSLYVEEGNTVYDSRNNCNAIIHTESNTLIKGCQNTTIPDSVTIIETYAFAGCTGSFFINIPNSVTSIGEYAFFECTGLRSVGIPSSVTTIGPYTFYNCTGLTYIQIKNGLTSIEERAFLLCEGLTLITIPNTVTNIGESAFYNCTSMTRITYTGSVAQWNAITKGANWNYGVPATVVYCTDGDAPLPTYS